MMGVTPVITGERFSMNDKLYAIDLFSGAGGLSEGLKEAGFEIKLANEVQKDAALTYRKNHPETKMIEGDIRKLSQSEIIPAIKYDVDLITAGPPCQGFSMAGRRDINDPRNQLFKELVRIVEEINLKFFLMENRMNRANDHNHCVNKLGGQYITSIKRGASFAYLVTSTTFSM